MDGDALITLEDLASLLSTSPKTVWRKVRQGKLPQPARYRRNYAGWNPGEVRLYLMSKEEIEQELTELAAEIAEMAQPRDVRPHRLRDMDTLDADGYREYLTGRRSLLTKRLAEMDS